MMQKEARVETQANGRYAPRSDRRPRLSFVGVKSRSLSRAVDLLLSTLREIFDESAYSRFLERHQIGTSRHAYAAFLRESQRQRERRPRCC
jgi:hypothetical protein